MKYTNGYISIMYWSYLLKWPIIVTAKFSFHRNFGILFQSYGFSLIELLSDNVGVSDNGHYEEMEGMFT